MKNQYKSTHTKLKPVLISIIIAGLLSGCTMTDGERTAVGGVSGAVLGGVIGHQISHKNGAIFGAVLGALAGGSIGHYMDNQQKQLEKTLAKSGVTVTRVNESTIKLNIPDAISFDTNKADIKPAVINHLNSLAPIFNEFKETAIHIEGHADSRGSDEFNLNLSQNRANNVGNYLASRGVVSGRIISRGEGEKYPIATNDTEAGRSMNRRVEIFIRAIESGKEQNAYSPIY